jgi:hypothetical protein
MDVCLLCLYVVLSCVGRGVCDGLITRPEESYRVSVCVWSRNPENLGQRSILDYKLLWMNERILSQSPYYLVRFHVLAASIMKMTVFWDAAPCSLIEIYRRFRGVTHRPDDGSSKHLWNISQILWHYTVKYPTRLSEPVNDWLMIVVDKVALGQVSLRVLRFSPVNIIPPWLSILTFRVGDEQ